MPMQSEGWACRGEAVLYFPTSIGVHAYIAKVFDSKFLVFKSPLSSTISFGEHLCDIFKSPDSYEEVELLALEVECGIPVKILKEGFGLYLKEFKRFY